MWGCGEPFARRGRIRITWFVRGRASRDTVGSLCPLCGEDPLQWCLSDSLPFPSLPPAFDPSIPVPREPKFPTPPHSGHGGGWGWGDRGMCPEPRPSQDAEAGARLSRSLSLESPLDQTGP